MRRKMIAALCAVIGALALVACEEQESLDGTIPNEAMTSAQKYVGVYSGRMAGVNGQIELTLSGNRPILRFVSVENSQDLLGSIKKDDCGSQIGALESYKVSKSSEGTYELKYAGFDFNSGRCKLLGRRLHLNFSKTRSGQIKITTDLLVEYGIPDTGPCFSDGGCWDNSTPDIYYSGKFKK